MRLSEANWRRRNVWESDTASRRAKEQRDNLIAEAERKALVQNGLRVATGGANNDKHKLNYISFIFKNQH